MGFSSAITRKKKKEREQRKERREIHLWKSQSFWNTFCEKYCERFWIISFERGFLLEESILTEMCYWVSSRLCTGISFCANQGVFLNPSWSCLNQDLRCFHCNFVKSIERLYCLGFRSKPVFSVEIDWNLQGAVDQFTGFWFLRGVEIDWSGL